MRSAEPPEDAVASVFPALLRRRRMCAGLTQNGLAERAGRDPGTINRLESGKRAPVNRELIEDLARALELPLAERDELLAAAGHLPGVYARVGLGDPDLRLVADLLGDASLGAIERRDLRLAIRVAARRWRDVPLSDLICDSTAQLTAAAGEGVEALEPEDDEKVGF